MAYSDYRDRTVGLPVWGITFVLFAVGFFPLWQLVLTKARPVVAFARGASPW